MKFKLNKKVIKRILLALLALVVLTLIFLCFSRLPIQKAQPSEYKTYTLILGRADEDIKSERKYEFSLPIYMNYEIMGEDASSGEIVFKKDNEIIFSVGGTDYVGNEEYVKANYSEAYVVSYVGGHTNALIVRKDDPEELEHFVKHFKIDGQQVFEFIKRDDDFVWLNQEIGDPTDGLAIKEIKHYRDNHNYRFIIFITDLLKNNAERIPFTRVEHDLSNNSLNIDINGIRRNFTGIKVEEKQVIKDDVVSYFVRNIAYDDQLESYSIKFKKQAQYKLYCNYYPAQIIIEITDNK